MNRASALALLCALGVALALRLPQLDSRPLHNDEGVNAVKLASLWERGDYRYDPHEYHGPTLHYFSLPFIALSSAIASDGRAGSPQPAAPDNEPAGAPGVTRPAFSDSQLRLVTVAFGSALLLLLLLLRDALGDAASAWAALFIAVSPAMVFYSRYFIHEMPLVFFTLLTLAAGWRFTQSRHPGWAGLCGTGIGLMSATKETFVLTLAALLFALGAARLWSRRLARPSSDTTRFTKRRDRWMPARGPLLAAGAGGGLVWLLFFSSFFTNASGPADSIRTYFVWLERAGGAAPHLHPWSFYLERLLWFHPAKSPPWTELAVFVLALIGAIAGFCGNRLCVVRPGFVRFLSFFTVALTALYSIISYKTPWCALNFWLGYLSLAGVGAAGLVNAFRDRVTRGLMISLLGVAALHLGIQAWLLSQRFPADLRNPYVYAQTSPHAEELIDRVRAIGRMAPEGFATVVKIISPESYWPLPWALREFKNIGWYDQLPADPFAPIVLTSAKLDAKLDDQSEKRWLMTGYYELRPNVFLELYVERGLWEKFVATLPRDVD
jgi:uncharacterized protein (TIGR03663 family)